MFDKLKGIKDGLGGAVGGLIEQAFERIRRLIAGIKGRLDGIVSGIAAVVVSVVDLTKRAILDKVAAVRSWITSVGSTIGAGISLIGDKIREKTEELKALLGGIKDQIVGTVKSGLSEATSFIKGIGTSVVSSIRQSFKDIGKGVQSAFSMIVERLKGIFEWAVGIVKKAIDGLAFVIDHIVDWSGDAVEDAMEQAMSMGRKVAGQMMGTTISESPAPSAL